MLEGLKRLLSGNPAPRRGWESLSPWAQAKGWTFRGVKASDGFVLESPPGALAWRLEWGPPQRSYIEGAELRLRAELGLPSDLQALLINRVLQEKLEKDVFEQYVEGVQTRIDTETPPEMRWLVMFPKLPAADMGRLRDRWVALGSVKPFLAQWVDGPLAATLAAMALPPAQPFVLMASRGRLSLRTPLAEPDPRDLEPWLRLFETAMKEARRIGSMVFEAGAPSTQPSLWSTGVPAPGDTPPKK